jgi:hypothetical protein
MPAIPFLAREERRNQHLLTMTDALYRYYFERTLQQMHSACCVEIIVDNNNATKTPTKSLRSERDVEIIVDNAKMPTESLRKDLRKEQSTKGRRPIYSEWRSTSSLQDIDRKAEQNSTSPRSRPIYSRWFSSSALQDRDRADTRYSPVSSEVEQNTFPRSRPIFSRWLSSSSLQDRDRADMCASPISSKEEQNAIPRSVRRHELSPTRSARWYASPKPMIRQESDSALICPSRPLESIESHSTTSNLANISKPKARAIQHIVKQSNLSRK